MMRAYRGQDVDDGNNDSGPDNSSVTGRKMGQAWYSRFFFWAGTTRASWQKWRAGLGASPFRCTQRAARAAPAM
jgi:hypothetical protein